MEMNYLYLKQREMMKTDTCIKICETYNVYIKNYQ